MVRTKQNLFPTTLLTTAEVKELDLLRSSGLLRCGATDTDYLRCRSDVAREFGRPPSGEEVIARLDREVMLKLHEEAWPTAMRTLGPDQRSLAEAVRALLVADESQGRILQLFGGRIYYWLPRRVMYPALTISLVSYVRETGSGSADFTARLQSDIWHTAGVSVAELRTLSDELFYAFHGQIGFLPDYPICRIVSLGDARLDANRGRAIGEWMVRAWKNPGAAKEADDWAAERMGVSPGDANSLTFRFRPRPRISEDGREQFCVILIADGRERDFLVQDVEEMRWQYPDEDDVALFRRFVADWRAWFRGTNG